MGVLLSYFLPRQHTSLWRSLAICSVAGLVSILIEIAADKVPHAADDGFVAWLHVLLLLVALAIRFVPVISASIAFCRRRGWGRSVDYSELAASVALIKDRVRGMFGASEGGQR